MRSVEFGTGEHHSVPVPSMPRFWLTSWSRPCATPQATPQAALGHRRADVEGLNSEAVRRVPRRQIRVKLARLGHLSGVVSGLPL
jgi:hypothetical protein